MFTGAVRLFLAVSLIPLAIASIPPTSHAQDQSSAREVVEDLGIDAKHLYEQVLNHTQREMLESALSAFRNDKAAPAERNHVFYGLMGSTGGQQIFSSSLMERELIKRSLVELAKVNLAAGPSPAELQAAEALIHSPNNNTLIANYRQVAKRPYEALYGLTAGDDEAGSSGSAALGMEEMVLRAIADIVIENAVATASARILESFRDRMGETEYQFLKTIFPNTHDLLTLGSSDPATNVITIFPLTAALQGAVRSDLDLLPENLIRTINDRDVKIAAGLTLTLARGLQNKEEPQELLNRLNEDISYSPADVNRADAWLWVKVFLHFGSKVIDDPQAVRKWISCGAERTLVIADLILLMHDAGITTVPESLIGKLSNSTSVAKIDWLRNTFCDLRRTLEGARAIAVGTNSGTEEDEIDANRHARFVQGFFAITHFAGELLDSIPAISGDADQKIPPAARQVLKVVNSCQPVVVAVSTGRYSAALPAAMTVLTETGAFDSDKKIAREAFKYMSLAAAVAQAENEEQMKEALRAAVVGPGGYVAKRPEIWFGINAYAGVALTWEQELRGGPGDQTLAPAMPIGIEMNFPKMKFLWLDPSFFVDLSVIDLGMLLSYRLENSDATISSSPDVAFKNVFSPGLNIGFGIRDWPLSLMFTVRSAPALRTRSTDEGTEEVGVLQYGAILAVDVPLLRF